ncbi:hypothetical protein ACFXAZ_08930 [Streptomyces sp. NPDC059477]|uniref:hypothetical protein n=1 Tax=Streptomyces sp. NPDC059477 TaxID=3346847 RepID=UPI0036C62BDA
MIAWATDNWKSPYVADAAELDTSELAINAVIHARRAAFRGTLPWTFTATPAPTRRRLTF